MLWRVATRGDLRKKKKHFRLKFVYSNSSVKVNFEIREKCNLLTYTVMFIFSSSLIFLLLPMLIGVTISDFLAQLSVFSKIIHKLIGNSYYVILSQNV